MTKSRILEAIENTGSAFDLDSKTFNTELIQKYKNTQKFLETVLKIYDSEGLPKIGLAVELTHLFQGFQWRLNFYKLFSNIGPSLPYQEYANFLEKADKVHVGKEVCERVYIAQVKEGVDSWLLDVKDTIKSTTLHCAAKAKELKAVKTEQYELDSALENIHRAVETGKGDLEAKG